MEKDFAETQVLCRLVVNFAEMAAKGHALLNRIENITTDQERSDLKVITGRLVLFEIFYSSLGHLQSFIHTIMCPCDAVDPNLLLILFGIFEEFHCRLHY